MLANVAHRYHQVVDYIVGWLFAGNDAFIEFFTPLCLEIADGIKSPFLFRECFAISVARQLASTNSSDITQVYPVESAAPSSPYQMAINAASLSLRRRVNEKWRHVFSMSWLETEIPLMKILSEFIISGDGKYGEDLVQAATDVYEYIRGTVESMLIQISAGML